jgi:type II restriction/modification system DNA methylase subunit YeeA
VNWSQEARDKYKSHGGLSNPKFWNKEGITWSLITSAITGFRIKYSEQQYSSGSPTIFNQEFKCNYKLLAFLNSPVSNYYLKAITPTVNTTVNDVFSLPFWYVAEMNALEKNVKACIEISRYDWDSFETSQNFKTLHLLNFKEQAQNIIESYSNLLTNWSKKIHKIKDLEYENNQIIISVYGLEDELKPDIDFSNVTLFCNPYYRYGNNKTEKKYRTLQQTDTIKELISYSVGCMMGRYSLDNPSLIYAHSENLGFDQLKYKSFPADDDGIIPIMDMDWFPDDATKRFIEFIKTAWPEEHLEENLKFVADSFNPKVNESPEDTIRRYLSTTFFKDHMKMYKKRPIYWLFSSGKQKAFECLVYLHRYNESTLSRMRSSYITPLQGNISARIEFLEHEKGAATTASAQKKVQKQIDVLKKKQVELKTFDDELRHYADMRISLDLDDGVKVNYGKFGNLLAQKKAITGKS